MGNVLFNNITITNVTCMKIRKSTTGIAAAIIMLLPLRVAVADDALWVGTSGVWDTTTLNWTRNSTNSAYVEGDAVTFNDSGTSKTVTSGGTLSPGSVTVSNTSTYTISATIGGTGTVTKLGSGTLTLSGTNTYTGGTVLSGGTLSISKDENLGATNGTLTINGATIAVTATTWLTNSRPVVLNSGVCAVRQGGNASFNIPGPVSGAGGIWYKTTSAGGNGFRLLSLTNTFTGELGLDTSTDRCSTYIASLVDSPGCSNIWFLPGGNKNTWFYWDASATNALVLNYRRLEFRGNSDAPQWMIQNDNATYPIIINTDLLVSGSGYKRFLFSAVNSAVTNLIAGSINDGTNGATVAIVKTGNGALVLSGNNSNSGTNTLSGGTLILQGEQSLCDNGILNITSGKVQIQTREKIDTLLTNGVACATGTWGSSASQADNKNDTYFIGTGILFVGIKFPAKGTVLILR